jgi:outer membrane protein assembly factor BamB
MMVSMMALRRTLVVCVAVLVVPAVPPSVAARSSIETEGDRPTILALDAGSGERKWSAGLGYDTKVLSLEYTLNGTLYGEAYRCAHYNRPVFYNTGAFVAIDLSNRAERWEVEVPDRDGGWSRAFGAGYVSVFGLGRKAIVIGGRDATLQGLSPETGEVLWEQPLGSAYPAGGNRRLVIAETPPHDESPGGLDFSVPVGGQLDARDRLTGELLWTWQPPLDWGVTRTVVSDDAVVAATFKPQVADALRGINVRTGEELWESELPSGALFLAEFDLFDSVLVNEEAGNIVGYEAKTGTRLWDFAGTVVRSQSGTAPPLLLVRSPSGNLVRLDPVNGSPLWRVPESSGVGPIAIGEHLIALSARTDSGRGVYETSPLGRREVEAIDAESGKTLWKRRVPREVAPGFGQSAIVSDDEVIMSGGCNVVPE